VKSKIPAKRMIERRVEKATGEEKAGGREAMLGKLDNLKSFHLFLFSKWDQSIGLSGKEKFVFPLPLKLIHYFLKMAWGS